MLLHLVATSLPQSTINLKRLKTKLHHINLFIARTTQLDSVENHAPSYHTPCDNAKKGITHHPGWVPRFVIPQEYHRLAFHRWKTPLRNVELIAVASNATFTHQQIIDEVKRYIRFMLCHPKPVWSLSLLLFCWVVNSFRSRPTTIREPPFGENPPWILTVELFPTSRYSPGW